MRTRTAAKKQVAPRKKQAGSFAEDMKTAAARMFAKKKGNEVAAKPQRGGARKNTGRKPLYGEKLTRVIAFRLNSEQSTAVHRYCLKNGYEGMMLARESALERAGLQNLALGLEKVRQRGLEEVGIKPGKENNLPPKFTTEQELYILKHCNKHKLKPGTFVKESLLAQCGAAHLGAEGAAARAKEATGED